MSYWLGVLALLAILIVPAYLYDRRRKVLVSSLRRERLTARDVHGHRESPGRVIYGGAGPGATGIWVIRPGSSSLNAGAGGGGGDFDGGDGD